MWDKIKRLGFRSIRFEIIVRHPNRVTKEQDGHRYLELRTETVSIYISVLSGMKVYFKAMGMGKFASGESVTWEQTSMIGLWNANI